MPDIVHFAWQSERIGLPRERVETEAKTGADLLREPRARDPRHDAAFAAPLAAVREGPFFPPMTGG